VARIDRAGTRLPRPGDPRPGREDPCLRRSLPAGDAGTADLSGAARSALHGGAGEGAEPHPRRERHDLPRLGPLPPAERVPDDEEIIPRVATFIQRDDRFQNTSVWILGQRRRLYLEGYVTSHAQSDKLEREVRLIDDVEA